MVFKTILTKKDIKQVAFEFKRTLKNAGIKVEQLILFGSYATNTPRAWSDIDFCVVSRQFGKHDYDDMINLSKLGKKVNYLIEAHPLNPKDIKSGSHPLAEEIKKKGKKI